ncbi:MAG: choice-of-anchor L domain-containing protein [Tannerella sp.]|nr:choice-of-anchor L domain-containing protein [Tannerella sp.]
MKHRILRNVLCCALLCGILTPATAQLQSKINFNLEQQVQIESLTKEYEQQGLDFKQARMKAEEKVSPEAVRLRIAESPWTYPNHAAWLASTPTAGSIHVDRDATIHGYTPEQLVKKILLKTYTPEDEVRIQNVRFKGWQGVSGGGNAWYDTNPAIQQYGAGNRGLAYFTKGTSNFDVERGLLISTGHTWGHEGPNQETAAFGSGVGYDGVTTSDTNPFDIDIFNDVILTSATWGGLLEFDFCPAVDMATFDYVFGSDEYPEYSNTQYNDGFGFFVSGPYETATEAATEGQNQATGYTSTTTVPGVTLPARNARNTITYNSNPYSGYYQYNIAQLPNGDPVSVNWTNWGWRDAYSQGDGNSCTSAMGWTYFPWDTVGASSMITGPGFNLYTSGYSQSPKAMNPEYHRANCDGSAMMELDGITVKLTAVADRLIPGKWYHLKMVVCQKDWAHGDGVFLGNLDLGQGTAGIDGDNTWNGWPAANDSIGLYYLYSGCEQTLKVNFTPQPFSQAIKIVPVGAAINAVAPDGTALALLDTLSAGEEDVIIPFKVDEDGDFENGEEGYFITISYNPAPPYNEYARDTTDVYKFYKRFTTDVKYRKPTVNYAGSLELNIKNGSPNLFRSLNGGQTWENAHKPFSQSQIANFVPDNDYILLKEPNSCWLSIDSVDVGTGEMVIERSVDVPELPGAITVPIAGRHYVNSLGNFVLTVTPTGANAGMIPVLTTNRTSIPDSEGVIRVDNGDGSYTFTIKMVQEPITISLDFATGNASIVNGDKVCSDNGQLYVTSTNAGVIRIFNAAGTLFKTFKVAEGETIQTALGTGLYIVTINDRVYKAFVK